MWERTEPNSSQRCTMERWEAEGTDWDKGSCNLVKNKIKPTSQKTSKQTKSNKTKQHPPKQTTKTQTKKTPNKPTPNPKLPLGFSNTGRSPGRLESLSLEMLKNQLDKVPRHPVVTRLALNLRFDFMTSLWRSLQTLCDSVLLWFNVGFAYSK